MTIIINSTNHENILTEIKKLRLGNYKNKWLFLEIHLGQEIIQMKSYNTSIQILRKDSVNFGSLFDATVKQFNEKILEAVNYES